MKPQVLFLLVMILAYSCNKPSAPSGRNKSSLAALLPSSTASSSGSATTGLSTAGTTSGGGRARKDDSEDQGEDRGGTTQSELKSVVAGGGSTGGPPPPPMGPTGSTGPTSATGASQYLGGNTGTTGSQCLQGQREGTNGLCFNTPTFCFVSGKSLNISNGECEICPAPKQNNQGMCQMTAQGCNENKLVFLNGQCFDCTTNGRVYKDGKCQETAATCLNAGQKDLDPTSGECVESTASCSNIGGTLQAANNFNPKPWCKFDAASCQNKGVAFDSLHSKCILTKDFCSRRHMDFEPIQATCLKTAAYCRTSEGKGFIEAGECRDALTNPSKETCLINNYYFLPEKQQCMVPTDFICKYLGYYRINATQTACLPFWQVTVTIGRIDINNTNCSTDRKVTLELGGILEYGSQFSELIFSPANQTTGGAGAGGTSGSSSGAGLYREKISWDQAAIPKLSTGTGQIKIGYEPSGQTELTLTLYGNIMGIQIFRGDSEKRRVGIYESTWETSVQGIFPLRYTYNSAVNKFIKQKAPLSDQARYEGREALDILIASGEFISDGLNWDLQKVEDESSGIFHDAARSVARTVDKTVGKKNIDGSECRLTFKPTWEVKKIVP